MNKKESEKRKVLEQYLANRYSSHLEHKVQRWITEEENDPDVEKASLDFFESLQAETNLRTYHKARKRVNDRIGYKPSGKNRFLSIYMRIASVMLILLLSGIGYYAYTKSQFMEIKVAYGEEQYLLLPDSSEVWINSGSRLKYPRKFKNEERLVYLEGEAYFSVKKNTASPFEVNTERLSIKVLGTKFNVKAYKDDNRTVTTLSTGKIAVETEDKQQVILEPNRQLSYDHVTSDINVVEVSTEESQSWINGQLIFVDANMDEIMKTLERRFNVTIHLSKRLSEEKELYTVKFIKNDSLEEIMHILGDMVGFTYQQQGKTLTVN